MRKGGKYMYKSKIRSSAGSNSNPINMAICQNCGYGCDYGCVDSCLYICADDCAIGCDVGCSRTCANDCNGRAYAVID